MSRSCAIALAGLSPTEQVLLEGALFPAAGGLIPGAYLEQDLAQAQLIIAGADDGAAVAALKARALPGHVLLLGKSDVGTGWPVVPRPLHLHAVTAAARRVLASDPRTRPGAARSARLAPHGLGGRPHASEPSGFEATRPYGLFQAGDTPDFESTRPGGPRLDQGQPVASGHQKVDDFQASRSFTDSVPSVVPSGWETEVAEWEGLRASRAVTVAAPDAGRPVERHASAGPIPHETRSRILIIGLPGTAAQELMKTLRAEGFETDFADGRDAAFRLLAQAPYAFVFVIEVSLGPAAIPLCQAIDANRGASPRDMRLVIVASHNQWLPRIRAWFAGCGAWMPIPLKQGTLVQFLKQHIVAGLAQG